MNKLTFTWGHGILLFFMSFVSFMIFMVYMTTTIDHDLVTSDYYKQEIEYQDKIDMKSNLANAGVHMEIEIEGNKLKISLPLIEKNSTENAKVYFYRPSDASKDITLEKHENGIFLIPTEKLIKGEYIIKSEWSSGGKKYYEEKTFVMP